MLSMAGRMWGEVNATQLTSVGLRQAPHARSLLLPFEPGCAGTSDQRQPTSACRRTLDWLSYCGLP